MRDWLTLIYLKDHQPSTTAKKLVDFWKGSIPMVSFSFMEVDTSSDLKFAKKKFKFNDLPCLQRGKGVKAQRYYGVGIESEVKRLKEIASKRHG